MLCLCGCRRSIPFFLSALQWKLYKLPTCCLYNPSSEQGAASWKCTFKFFIKKPQKNCCKNIFNSYLEQMFICFVSPVNNYTASFPPLTTCGWHKIRVIYNSLQVELCGSTEIVIFELHCSLSVTMPLYYIWPPFSFYSLAELYVFRNKMLIKHANSYKTALDTSNICLPLWQTQGLWTISGPRYIFTWP